MPAGVVPNLVQPKLNPRFLPAIDRVLITGIKLGASGKHQAINRVLQLVPEWKRGDCWRRIRQLRRSPLVSQPELRFRQNQKAPQKEPSSARRQSRPWSAEEDAKLLDWAGYEPARKIAQRLNRSVRAVRFRLGALGMSARVSDGWSLRQLQKLLHAGPATLRRWIGTGMLRVRDPRITAKSMLRLCTRGISPDNASCQRFVAVFPKQTEYPWERAADALGISIEQVQEFICRAQLKVRDPFVTDRSFEEFCRKHGDQINMSLIDPATARWLVEEYGVTNGNNRSISRAQRHAFVVRTCRCGRNIAGNVYFKHVKYCVGRGQEVKKAS